LDISVAVLKPHPRQVRMHAIQNPPSQARFSQNRGSFPCTTTVTAMADFFTHHAKN
jgi:hypothetical protein